MRSTKPNWNSGKPWSAEAVEDLRLHVAQKRTVAETAHFLCRSIDEVKDKATELDLSFVDAQH